MYSGYCNRVRGEYTLAADIIEKSGFGMPFTNLVVSIQIL